MRPRVLERLPVDEWARVAQLGDAWVVQPDETAAALVLVALELVQDDPELIAHALGRLRQEQRDRDALGPAAKLRA